MTNPYLRAAAKHPHIREQALERANKRPEWAGRPGKPDKPPQSGGQGQPKNPGSEP